MLKNTLLSVVALALVSTTHAQFQVQAHLGRHVTLTANLAGCVPVRSCVPPASGHWETITERVWVPGECRTVHIPAQYGWVTDRCGYRRWVEICPARCEIVQDPGRWECRQRQVWVSHDTCGGHSDYGRSWSDHGRGPFGGRR